MFSLQTVAILRDTSVCLRLVSIHLTSQLRISYDDALYAKPLKIPYEFLSLRYSTISSKACIADTDWFQD